MNDLPKGWDRAPVGVLAALNPKTDAPDETPSGFAPMQMLGTTYRARLSHEPRAWGDVKKAYTHFCDGDVLIAKVTPCFENGKAGIASGLPSGIGAGSSEFYVLRPNTGVDSRYLLAYLSTADFRRRATMAMTGAVGLRRVPRDFLLSDELPIAPSAEQKRIADKLDTVLTRVDAINTRLARVAPILKRFRQSVLAAATSGRLTEDWRQAQASHLTNAKSELEEVLQGQVGRLRVRGESARVSRGDLYELPESWAWVQNYQLAEDDSNAICAGPFGTIFKAKDFREEGVPIIFLRHVGEGRYLTHKPGFMATEVWREHHQPYSVFGGELLVTKLGDPPGTACIYPEGVGTAMVTPDVMKMSVNQRAAEPHYLMHFFNSPNSKKIVEALCFGVTRLRIDLSMFKTFPVPLPSRKEQTEIVRRVEALFTFADRLEVRLQAAETTTKRLTPALLAKAFRGELVPQDPNDEPASELLRRLQAETPTSEPKRGRKAAA